MFYKSDICMIDSELYTNDHIEVICKIINFGDIYFFAQEISTGCIFPIYCFKRLDDKSAGFVSASYLQFGKYYAYVPMRKKANDNFKFTIVVNNDFKLATVDEVNNYLKEKNATYSWRKKMEQMEATNKYFCDLSEIKNAISKLNDGVLDFNFNDIEPTIVDYKPPIDIDPIKEFGYDLSLSDNLCNLIGREDKIKDIVNIVGIKGKSAILLGESGSGKTSVVEKLALDIRNGKCEFLAGKTIFYLSAASLEAGTKYRGSFTEKFQKLIDF